MASPKPEITLILAVHPYLPYAELKRRYTPLTRYLSGRLGRSIEVRVGHDYDEHLTRVGRDQVDIAFMGPAGYVECTRKYGSKPLLARLEFKGRPEFKGAIVTRRDSGIQNLAQVRGRRVAFGDRNSTMSHLLPKYMLEQAGVDLESLADYQYLGSHTNVALGVLAGDFDVGGVKQEVYEHYESQGLRLLSWTPSLSEHVFLTRSNLDPDVIGALRTAMLQLGASSDGVKVLGAIKNGLTGLVAVNDSDYDNLRKILQGHATGDY